VPWVEESLIKSSFFLILQIYRLQVDPKTFREKNNVPHTTTTVAGTAEKVYSKKKQRTIFF
jgi:hypothetical protein